MKKVLFLLFFIPTTCFAQEEETLLNKHELGISIFTAKRFENAYSYPHMMSTAIYLFPGLYYKNHFGKNAWRISLDYMHKTISNGVVLNQSQVRDQYFSKLNNLALTAGYERSFGSRKFHPYVFSDLVFNYENNTGKRMNISWFPPFGAVDFSDEFFEFGISLGAGMRYQFTPLLSVTYEINAEGVVSTYQDVLNAGDKQTGVRMHINPVNKFGLGITF